MKQEVYVIGPELRELVPFSLAFGSQYAITLVQTKDVWQRAAELSSRHEAWFLLLLSADEDAAPLERLAPAASMLIEEGDDPLVALAHLIAASAWETSQPEKSPAGTAVNAKEQHG